MGPFIFPVNEPGLHVARPTINNLKVQGTLFELKIFECLLDCSEHCSNWEDSRDAKGHPPGNGVSWNEERQPWAHDEQQWWYVCLQQMVVIFSLENQPEFQPGKCLPVPQRRIYNNSEYPLLLNHYFRAYVPELTKVSVVEFFPLNKMDDEILRH